MLLSDQQVKQNFSNVQNSEQHEDFGRDKWAGSFTLNRSEIRLNVATYM